MQALSVCVCVCDADNMSKVISSAACCRRCLRVQNMNAGYIFAFVSYKRPFRVQMIVSNPIDTELHKFDKVCKYLPLLHPWVCVYVGEVRQLDNHFCHLTSKRVLLPKLRTPIVSFSPDKLGYALS